MRRWQPHRRWWPGGERPKSCPLAIAHRIVARPTATGVSFPGKRTRIANRALTGIDRVPCESGIGNRCGRWCDGPCPVTPDRAQPGRERVPAIEACCGAASAPVVVPHWQVCSATLGGHVVTPVQFCALSLGSRTSRTASPNRLKPNTASVIATPGQIGTQGALSANSSAPPCSIRPQAAVGSWTPSPR